MSHLQRRVLQVGAVGLENLFTTGVSTINDHFFGQVLFHKCFGPFLTSDRVLKS
jgi:hypothetical protein